MNILQRQSVIRHNMREYTILIIIQRIRRSINSGTESLFQFVISDWISESISAGRLLPEKDFYPEP